MNLNNGMFIKAQVRAVKNRSMVNKKTGEIMQFASVIVEEDPAIDKREINFSRAQVAKRFDVEFEKFVGKTCIVPFYFSFRDGYLNLHYSGEELPQIVGEPPKGQAA